MNTQTIKAFVIFLIITGIIFFAANSFAPEYDPNTVGLTVRSAEFLTLAADLEAVQVDFGFVDRLGAVDPITNVFVSDPRTSSIGRDNPFRKTGASVQVDRSRGAAPDFSSFTQESDSTQSLVPDFPLDLPPGFFESLPEDVVETLNSIGQQDPLSNQGSEESPPSPFPPQTEVPGIQQDASVETPQTRDQPPIAAPPSAGTGAIVTR